MRRPPQFGWSAKTNWEAKTYGSCGLDSEFEPPQTRYISVTSGLLLKEEGWITAKGLGTVPRSVAYDDYREVAGSAAARFD